MDACLRLDKNGACYGIFPDSPLLELPNLNKGLFAAMVVAGKVVAALRPHAEVIIFESFCLNDQYNEKSMFAGGQSHDCLARDVPGGPGAALLGHEHAVLDDLLTHFILNANVSRNAITNRVL